jgi:hypothetical protein
MEHGTQVLVEEYGVQPHALVVSGCPPLHVSMSIRLPCLHACVHAPPPPTHTRHNPNQTKPTSTTAIHQWMIQSTHAHTRQSPNQTKTKPKPNPLLSTHTRHNPNQIKTKTKTKPNLHQQELSTHYPSGGLAALKAEKLGAYLVETGGASFFVFDLYIPIPKREFSRHTKGLVCVCVLFLFLFLFSFFRRGGCMYVCVCTCVCVDVDVVMPIYPILNQPSTAPPLPSVHFSLCFQLRTFTPHRPIHPPSPLSPLPSTHLLTHLKSTTTTDTTTITTTTTTTTTIALVPHVASNKETMKTLLPLYRADLGAVEAYVKQLPPSLPVSGECIGVCERVGWGWRLFSYFCK